MVKLSIIIPIYNCGNFLSSCLDSIIKTNEKIEIILIDDGSIDNSLNICYEYAKKDKRIKVIHKENSGVSSARNLGLKNACGEYLMFVDADDMLSGEWDKILNYIDEKDIYYFTSIDKNTDREKLLEYICGVTEDRICLGGPISKVFKKSILIDNNIFFDENIINGEDMLFNIEMLFNSDLFEIIDFQFYYYRQVIGQSTRKFDVKLVQSDIRFHKILNKKLNEYKIDKKIANKIKKYSLSNAIIVILNRISYAKNFKHIGYVFDYFENKPYAIVINNINEYKNENKNIYLFILLRHKKYRTIYYILKIKNRILLLLKHKSQSQFIKI